jgi:heptose I phosphotransferase
MVDITLALHRRRYFHKDLYLCHFYIPEEDTGRLPDWHGRVWLIDLHRLAHHPWSSWWWRAKDLAQLLYSSDVPGVTERDRLWFWHLYRQGERLGWSGSFLRWWARAKAWNHHRRARRKRR